MSGQGPGRGSYRRGDLRGPPQSWHLTVEALATLALILGIGVEARYLMQMLRCQSRIERGIGIASGALHELVENVVGCKGW